MEGGLEGLSKPHMTSAEARTWEETQGMGANPAVFRSRETDREEGSDRPSGLEREPESPYKPGSHTKPLDTLRPKVCNKHSYKLITITCTHSGNGDLGA